MYLLNISPTKAALNQTPYEAWKGTKPLVSHLRIFGCIAYVLVNFRTRQKLDEKSEKCIFIGYSLESKAYRLYNPLSGKVIISRNVIFDEEKGWKWSGSNAEIQYEASLDEVMDSTSTNSSSLTPNSSSPESSPSST